MTAVSAGTDPAELLVAGGMLLAGLASIRPAVHAYVAWFNRHLTPSAAADVRALRGGRVSLSAASPAAEDPAVGAALPNAVPTARGAQR